MPQQTIEDEEKNYHKVSTSVDVYHQLATLTQTCHKWWWVGGALCYTATIKENTERKIKYRRLEEVDCRDASQQASELTAGRFMELK